MLAATLRALAAAQFFPIKAHAGDPGLSEFSAGWYSENLSRMKEPRLIDASTNIQARIYRFLILPTWGNAVAVRVEKKRGSYVVSSRRLAGEAGFKSGELVEEHDP